MAAWLSNVERSVGIGDELDGEGHGSGHDAVGAALLSASAVRDGRLASSIAASGRADDRRWSVFIIKPDEGAWVAEMVLWKLGSVIDQLIRFCVCLSQIF